MLYYSNDPKTNWLSCNIIAQNVVPHWSSSDLARSSAPIAARWRPSDAPKASDLHTLKVPLKNLRATNRKLFMTYLRKERAPMPITKARLDRMIDMIDSAWLKRRDSEGRNTDPKQFQEPSRAPQQPFSDSPPDMPKEPLWGDKPPIPIAHL